MQWVDPGGTGFLFVNLQDPVVSAPEVTDVTLYEANGTPHVPTAAAATAPRELQFQFNTDTPWTPANAVSSYPDTAAKTADGRSWYVWPGTPIEVS